MMAKFIFAVAVGLVSGLIGYILKRSLRVLSATWEIRVRYVLGGILVLTGPVFIYIVFSWFLQGKLSDLQFQVALCASLAQIVIGYLLYCLFDHEIEQRILSAIGAKARQYADQWRLMDHLAANSGKAGTGQYSTEPMCVEAGESKNSVHTILVHRLNTAGLNPGQRLYFNAKTLTDGIAFLKKQIDDYAPVIEPDLCVGINNVGGVLAGYFSRNLGKGGIPLGFVRTEGQRQFNPVTDILLPKCKEAKTILVADIEVKRGLTLASISDILRKKYGADTRIVIAVLVASEVRGPIKKIEHLTNDFKGVFKADPEYYPDFLAFTSSNKVRLYGNIR